MHPETFHKNELHSHLTVITPVIIALFFLDFSYYYIYICRIFKLGQTGALPGPTEVAPTFSGIKGALPARTMPILVTTGAHRDETVLHWDYRPNTGANRGEGCLQRARFITVETQMLRLLSWLTTVLDSLPGDSR